MGENTTDSLDDEVNTAFLHVSSNNQNLYGSIFIALCFMFEF